VTTASPLIRVWPPDALTDQARTAARRYIVLGPERSLHADVGYGIRQLSDVAAKALSPGINDPTTAIDCIGHLRELIERLAVRDLPATVGLGAPGGAHLTAVRPTFDDYLAAAFDDVGRYASGNARVVVALLDALGSIAHVAAGAGHGGDRVASVTEVADAIAGPALADARTERDRRIIDAAMAWMGRPVS